MPPIALFIQNMLKRTLTGDKEPIYALKPSVPAPQKGMSLFSHLGSKEAAKYPNSDWPSLHLLMLNHSTRPPKKHKMELMGFAATVHQTHW